MVDPRKHAALWPAGLVAWMATTVVVATVSTPADGCADRAIVTGIAWGGVPAIVLIGADVARRRKLGPGVLLGCTIFAALTARASGRSTQGDCDHLVGLALSLTLPLVYVAFIVGPVAAIYVLWRLFARLETSSAAVPRPRRWRVEVKDRSLVITRRKPRG